MSNPLDKTLLRFLFVGVINTLVGMIIMFGLYNIFRCSYWISSSANYILTSILSFFLNKHFTFQSKGFSTKQLFRFTINIVICYVLAYGIAKPFIFWVLRGADTVVQDNTSMLVGMCLFTGFNYIGQRYFAFANGGNKK